MGCTKKYNKTLVDLARQSKIITGTTACFDGKIQAGIPFSGYPTGVDMTTLTNVGISSPSLTCVFSGNSFTTLFDVSNPTQPGYNPIFDVYSGYTWSGNPIFNIYTSGLTLPITVYSALTQTVGPILFPATSGFNGEHPIVISYTGYSIQYSFTDILGLPGGDFTPSSPPGTGFTSGFTSALQVFYTASSLDYRGPLDYLSSKENANISNELTTKKLKVTGGASSGTIGSVLRQVDEFGTAEWGSGFTGASADTNTFVVSGTFPGAIADTLVLNYNIGGSVPAIDLSSLRFSGNTSGDCISDLFVTNIDGCSPITFHSSIQHIGSSATGLNSIVWGSGNTSSDNFSSILGGQLNSIMGNSVGCENNTIVGGSNNTMSGFGSATSDNNTILGGLSNTMSARSLRSAIIGGTSNIIGVSGGTTANSVIVGGTSNIFPGLTPAINSVILGGTGITGLTGNTVYVPNLNIGTVGGSGSMFNLGVDNSGFVVTGDTPIVKYVITLSELTTAFDAFKTQGVGGIIKMGASISLSSDLELDFDQGIELWGGSFGFSMNGNVITVKGVRATFRNVAFTGTVNFGSLGVGNSSLVNSQNVIKIDDGSMAVVKFIECRMNDIVGGYNPTSSADTTYPVIIEDCNDWSVFEFIYFAIGTQSSIQDKEYGPFLVKWNVSGLPASSGTRLMFKDWYCNSPEIDTKDTRFASAKAAMGIKIDGTTGTQLQDQVIYDQSLTVDEASTWPNLDKYSTAWGPIVKQLSVDPTVTNTFGYPGDIQISGNTAYMKVGSVTSIGSVGDTDWIQLGVGGGTFTGNTSGDCITDLFITNLHGCSPITVHNSLISNTANIETLSTLKNNLVFGENHTLTGFTLPISIENSVLLGGENNTMNPDFSIATRGAIIGGENNSISGRSENAFIAGSVNSTIQGAYLGPGGSIIGSTNSSIVNSIGTAIIGGSGNNIYSGSQYSTVIGGIGNVMGLNASKSVILGGQNITGTTDDTVYVPNLNIGTIGSGSPSINLGLDSSGNIVTGTTGLGGSGTVDFVTRWTPDGNTLGNSIIQDDGTTLGIGTSPSALYQMSMLTTSIARSIDITNATNTATFSVGLQMNNYGNLGDKTGIIGIGNTINTDNVSVGGVFLSQGASYGTSPTKQYGVIVAVDGNQGFTHTSVGVEIQADDSHSGDTYGIIIDTSNAGTGDAYIGKLQDGTEGAGKVLTSDALGVATWAIPAGGGSFTGNTSGDCITDLFITNLYGCSPVTVHDNLQHVTSLATGINSIAWGSGTTASGNLSYTKGIDTIASGIGSHAEGSGTTAIADYSHVEGGGTLASFKGTYGHAEGYVTEAGGAASHAEGLYTLASGNGAHAEGIATSAMTTGAHAEGGFTIAGGICSHAGGYALSIDGAVQSMGIASFAHFYNPDPGNHGVFADGSAILGGKEQYINEGAEYSAIIGGSINQITGTTFTHWYGGIIGGQLNKLFDAGNSVIVGGDGNRISGAENTIILGGTGIVGTESNTVYVPNLIATSISATTSYGTKISEIFLGPEEFAFPTAQAAGQAVLNSTSTGFLSFIGTGSNAEYAGVGFRIPPDYNSEPEFSIQWSMDGTSAGVARFALNITSGNTITQTDLHTDIAETVVILDNGYSGTSWRILQTPYSTSSILYSPGDYIHVEIERDPANGSDTMSRTGYVSGLIFKYKANIS